jgi:hypothetical protein
VRSVELTLAFGFQPTQVLAHMGELVRIQTVIAKGDCVRVRM